MSREEVIEMVANRLDLIKARFVPCPNQEKLDNCESRDIGCSECWAETLIDIEKDGKKVIGIISDDQSLPELHGVLKPDGRPLYIHDYHGEKVRQDMLKAGWKRCLK